MSATQIFRSLSFGPVGRRRLAAFAVLGVLMSGGLQACALGGSSAGKTTCSEFAEMGADTGLTGNLTSKQEGVIKDMMKEHHAIAGQESMAAFQVIAYCNIYSGRAGSHRDDAIDNIPGLQD